MYIVIQVCILLNQYRHSDANLCTNTFFIIFAQEKKTIQSIHIHTHANHTQQNTTKTHSWMVMTLVNKVSACYDPVYICIPYVTRTHCVFEAQFALFFFSFGKINNHQTNAERRKIKQNTFQSFHNQPHCTQISDFQRSLKRESFRFVCKHAKFPLYRNTFRKEQQQQ